MRRVIAPGILLGLLAASLAPIVAAAPADAATTSCAAGVCTVRFAPTGAPETYTVPAGIDAVTITAAGAQGHAGLFNGAGGLGGTSTGTLVTAGQTLTIVVGSRGGLGGGGAAGSGDGWESGNGGGGSYVFAGGSLLLAAGGGGGAGARLSSAG